jgi:hypothetical protein
VTEVSSVGTCQACPDRAYDRDVAGSPAPTANRRRLTVVARAVRRAGAGVLTAVFGYGLVTGLALVASGAVLYLAFGLTTGGIAVGIAGVVVGLVFAVAQGALA